MWRKKTSILALAVGLVAAAGALFLLVSPDTSGGVSAQGPGLIKLKFKYDKKREFDDGNFKIRWKFDGDELKVALESNYEKYMAFGISTKPKMKGADIIFVKIEGGNIASVEDHFGHKKNDHDLDTALGGSSSIKKFHDRSAGGWKTVEIVIDAHSDDPNDVPIVKGESYYILVAGSSKPAWLGVHPFYDKFKVKFE